MKELTPVHAAVLAITVLIIIGLAALNLMLHTTAFDNVTLPPKEKNQASSGPAGQQQPTGMASHNSTDT